VSFSKTVDGKVIMWYKLLHNYFVLVK